MIGMFRGVGIKLVDFKLEFGRIKSSNKKDIILADEISPDTCRLWDALTEKKLDKDRFRKDLGNIIQAYQEVARRLGIIHKENNESEVLSTSITMVLPTLPTTPFGKMAWEIPQSRPTTCSGKHTLANRLPAVQRRKISLSPRRCCWPSWSLQPYRIDWDASDGRFVLGSKLLKGVCSCQVGIGDSVAGNANGVGTQSSIASYMGA